MGSVALEACSVQMVKMGAGGRAGTLSAGGCLSSAPAEGKPAG